MIDLVTRVVQLIVMLTLYMMAQHVFLLGIFSVDDNLHLVVELGGLALVLFGFELTGLAESFFGVATSDINVHGYWGLVADLYETLE